MTSTDRQIDDTLEILLDELIGDEELLESFIRNPGRTLRYASDWALPLTESELHSLRNVADRLCEKLAAQLESRRFAA